MILYQYIVRFAYMTRSLPLFLAMTTMVRFMDLLSIKFCALKGGGRTSLVLWRMLVSWKFVDSPSLWRGLRQCFVVWCKWKFFGVYFIWLIVGVIFDQIVPLWNLTRSLRSSIGSCVYPIRPIPVNFIFIECCIKLLASNNRKTMFNKYFIMQKWSRIQDMTHDWKRFLKKWWNAEDFWIWYQ